ncbi:MAG: hypothetical protein JSS43_16260, partial [Proteobacteria bacterium]|nr:hypothetical protein [Pseudomonadota bacterium]
DRPKLLLAIGSGHTGKSLLLRWIAERAAERDGQVILATIAPNRTLKHYFPEAITPEGNSTSSGAQFLESFLDVVAEDKTPAVLDFPGDDTALLHLLDQGLDPIGMMAESGVEVVALYTLSPRVEDLTAMAQLAAKGFTPKATALILNKGLTADPTVPPEPAFDQVVEHSAFRAAVERGAVTVWMPRLYAAKAIEDRRLLFGQARSGPELGPSDRSRTHHWLAAMERAFAGIASWLP